MNLNRLREKLERNHPLRVLFINDLGFQYGAGLALLRQIQSFLLMGWEVAGLCWRRGLEADIAMVPKKAKGIWKGLKELTNVDRDHGCGKKQISEAIENEVLSYDPDVVVIGNLHGAGWPLEMIFPLRDMEGVVVAYMHDCYLVTGRCAYPGTCDRFLTGCDDKCPRPEEYPPLHKKKIREEWDLRRRLFDGDKGIFLAANSEWTLGMAKKALPRLRYGDVLYYGLDTDLFSPVRRDLSRRMLGLPEDRFIVLIGAVNLGDRRKGWHILKDVVKIMAKDALFLAFGENTLQERNVHAVGLLRDYRKMPLLYSASDLFIMSSIEEAFGQTVIEASACEIPVVAFQVGGIVENAIHGVNAWTSADRSAGSVMEGIRYFMSDRNTAVAFGKAGRQMVQGEFSLERQGERWRDYLMRLTA